jgi:pimeloyl-ACP methyl ester carboxylesterase
VLDHFKIPKVALIGWSNGGIIGFDMAMNFTSRLDQLFSFAGNYEPSNIRPDLENGTVVREYFARAEMEYRDPNPRPDNYPAFLEKMGTLWSNQPKWNAASFARILTPFYSPEAPLIWIVGADHDEAIIFDTQIRLYHWESPLAVV